VGVTVERALGVTVLGLVAGEVPDDESLVSATGKEHVGAVSKCKLLFSTTQFGSIWSYFSIDVAKLVTQPFCKKLPSV